MDSENWTTPWEDHHEHRNVWDDDKTAGDVWGGSTDINDPEKNDEELTISSNQDTSIWTPEYGKGRSSSDTAANTLQRRDDQVEHSILEEVEEDDVKSRLKKKQADNARLKEEEINEKISGESIDELRKNIREHEEEEEVLEQGHEEENEESGEIKQEQEPASNQLARSNGQAEIDREIDELNDDKSETDNRTSQCIEQTRATIDLEEKEKPVYLLGVNDVPANESRIEVEKEDASEDNDLNIDESGVVNAAISTGIPSNTDHDRHGKSDTKMAELPQSDDDNHDEGEDFADFCEGEVLQANSQLESGKDSEKGLQQDDVRRIIARLFEDDGQEPGEDALKTRRCQGTSGHEDEEIYSILDVTVKGAPVTTRRLYSEITRPTRQFILIADPDRIVRWAGSSVEAELKSVLQGWKSHTDTSRAAMFGWSKGIHRTPSSRHKMAGSRNRTAGIDRIRNTPPELILSQQRLSFSSPPPTPTVANRMELSELESGKSSQFPPKANSPARPIQAFSPTLVPGLSSASSTARGRLVAPSLTSQASSSASSSPSMAAVSSTQPVAQAAELASQTRFPSLTVCNPRGLMVNTVPGGSSFGSSPRSPRPPSLVEPNHTSSFPASPSSISSHLGISSQQSFISSPSLPSVQSQGLGLSSFTPLVPTKAEPISRPGSAGSKRDDDELVTAPRSMSSSSPFALKSWTAKGESNDSDFMFSNSSKGTTANNNNLAAISGSAITNLHTLPNSDNFQKSGASPSNQNILFDATSSRQLRPDSAIDRSRSVSPVKFGPHGLSSSEQKESEETAIQRVLNSLPDLSFMEVQKESYI